MDFENLPIGEDFCYSECGKYRYLRWKKCSDGRPCVFVMLHPVGSSKEKISATTRNCRKVARFKGCSGVISVNLLPYMTKNADTLRDAGNIDIDEIMKKNEEYIYDALQTPNALIIVAWGNAGGALKKEVESFKKMAKSLNKEIWCLALTNDGNPHHPARFPVKEGLELVRFPLD